MHTPLHRNRRGTVRLLVMDGSPGSAALLVLATQGAIPSYDHVVVPDTGWYPEITYRYLARLLRVAEDAGIDVVFADAGGIAAQCRDGAHPCPLPLHTRSDEGILGRLPGECAHRQAMALTHQVAHVIATHPAPEPAAFIAECALGLSVEHTRHATTTDSDEMRLRYPLIDIGWTSSDCRAYLHQHNLGEPPGLACVACPERSNAGWAELRVTEPQAFEEATAVDAALRHGPPQAAPRGMPRGTTYYLHPDRVPVGQANLDPQNNAEVEGCLPRACRGHAGGIHREGGDAA